MREYESVTVLHPTMSEAEVDAEIQAIEALIGSTGGELIETERWGRRRLAYEIQRVHEAIYTHYRFKADAATLTELDRRYRLNERLLRHLTIVSDGPPPRAEEESSEGEHGERGHRPREAFRREAVIED